MNYELTEVTNNSSLLSNGSNNVANLINKVKKERKRH